MSRKKGSDPPRIRGEPVDEPGESLEERLAALSEEERKLFLDLGAQLARQAGSKRRKNVQ
jgi:hypothetical protein